MGFRSRAVIALLVMSSASLTACSGPTAEDTAEDTVVVGLTLEPTDLDIRRTSGVALDQVLIDNVYEGLVSRTDDGQIVDRLAESHTVSDDGLRYEFTLHDGITFHDGVEVTSATVIASLEEVQTDDSILGSTDLAGISSIEAPDDRTVRVTIEEPDSQLLWNLAGRAGLVLPQHSDINLSETAIGTGPFTFSQWRQGDSISLSRNDTYWGIPARVSGVVFSYIPDQAAAVNAVITGDVDVLTNVDPFLLERVEDTEGLSVTVGKTTDTFVLAFNNTRAPFTDSRVRQAIRQAIDHEGLVAALGGTATPLGGPIPELDPGYEDLSSLTPYDPERSRGLLAEAGTPSLDLTLTIPNHYSETIGSILTTQLAAVGIALTVNTVEFPTWLNDVYTNHDYELSVVDHAEARDFVNWTNPEYYFGYDNSQVRKLYTQAMTAADQHEAESFLSDAARIVSEESASDWLFTASALTAIPDSLNGFPTDSTTARLNLSELTWTNETSG